MSKPGQRVVASAGRRASKKAAPQPWDMMDADADEDGDRPEAEDLSVLEMAFVAAFTKDTDCAGNVTKAAVQAGYTELSARNSAYRVMNRPRVRNAIDAALREAIGTELTVQAIQVFRTVLASDEASLKLKSDIASKVIEFSGLVDRTKLQKAKDTGLGDGKRLAEMSREELEAVVNQGAAVLRAASVTSLTVEGTAHETV